MSVVVVITRSEEIDETLCWGQRFAQARDEELLVLHSTTHTQHKSPMRLPLEETSSLPLLDEIREACLAIEPAPALYHAQDPDRKDGILMFLKENKASLLVTGHYSTEKSPNDPGPSLRKALLDEAPCDVVLLRARPESSAFQGKGIIIPAAGGPHATAALRLAAQVADNVDCQVKAIFIEQEAGEDAEAVGQQILKRVMSRAGIPAESNIKSEIVLADNVTEGILRTAEQEENLGLILLGASNQGFVRRALFGDVPERLLEGNHQMTVGVMRAAQPLTERTRVLLVDLLERWIPPMTREERINLFERLQSGSQASVDFVALICLSTAIAALGLIQNSGAVIIGAMLVAPLMTPMLGMGLGLVQGNIVLVRKAIFSIAIGFLLSFLIGLVLGLMVPSFRALTPEMLARGQPNLLDLFVALFSGVAAAYALARPGLLEALPGVAIAAALVPPIATAGSSLALGHTNNSVGAASLFGVNLVAIILASSLTLYVMGIRANKGQRRLWARRTLIGLFLVAMLIALPLSTALLAQLPNPFKPLNNALKNEFKMMPGVSLARLVRKKKLGRDVLELRLYTPKRLTTAQTHRLARVVRKHTESSLTLRFVSILVTEYEGKETPSPTSAAPTRRTPSRSVVPRARPQERGAQPRRRAARPKAPQTRRKAPPTSPPVSPKTRSRMPARRQPQGRVVARRHAPTSRPTTRPSPSDRRVPASR